MTQTKQSKIFSKVLSPAIKLWLRSQIEASERLDFNIEGGDRQIISGYIPNIFLEGSGAIYRGIHLTDVELVGDNIRINIGQVIRGKPLRLLEPIKIDLKVILDAADLERSIASPLLSAGLTDFFLKMLESRSFEYSVKIKQQFQIQWQKIAIDRNKLVLNGILIDRHNRHIPVIVTSGLALINPQTLHLYPLKIETIPPLINVNLNEFQLDLGSAVAISELNLLANRLVCCGRIAILP